MAHTTLALSKAGYILAEGAEVLPYSICLT
jgi:hypothetical protein